MHGVPRIAGQMTFRGFPISQTAYGGTHVLWALRFWLPPDCSSFVLCTMCRLCTSEGRMKGRTNLGRGPRPRCRDARTWDVTAHGLMNVRKLRVVHASEKPLRGPGRVHGLLHLLRPPFTRAHTDMCTQRHTQTNSHGVSARAHSHVRTPAHAHAHKGITFHLWP
jgi:hypothetical protein